MTVLHRSDLNTNFKKSIRNNPIKTFLSYLFNCVLNLFQFYWVHFGPLQPQNTSIYSEKIKNKLDLWLWAVFVFVLQYHGCPEASLIHHSWMKGFYSTDSHQKLANILSDFLRFTFGRSVCSYFYEVEMFTFLAPLLRK